MSRAPRPGPKGYLQWTWFSDDGVPDYLYTVSMNGWISNNIGLAWLRQIFLPQTQVASDQRRYARCDTSFLPQTQVASDQRRYARCCH